MVHALQQTWRVTRDAVLDIRPRVGDPRVLVRDRNGREIVCGGLRWNSGGPEGHPEADAALARVVAEGWFAVQAEREFDWIDEYDSADDLANAVHEEWESRELDEETAVRLMKMADAAGHGAAAIIRQAIGARWLRKLPPPRPSPPLERGVNGHLRAGASVR